jgi:DNA-binding NarL/FixJ family response regulator
MKIARLWAQRGTIPQPVLTEQLSARETEVLELAARGLRNKAIAEKLGISTRTVEGHFNGIFTKLGVSSRLAAILEAMSRHLVIINDENKS